ncbi:MAG: hypothetical protein ACK2T2_11855 [Anaerolineales bacterium]
MKQRAILILMLLLTLAGLLLAACTGGTSGSIVRSSQSCKTGGGSGSCTGKIGTLTGTYGMDIEDEGIFNGDAIDVQITATVENGLVEITVEDPDGKAYSVQVEPGAQAELLGVSTGEFDGFQVTFRAVDGQAEGLSYELIYQSR